ncbi:MAG TPA: response regulator transcription factor [Candidatus Sulfotelmatobacter sp.]|nr:response regulator transcription factor [Candidatus Sulfotelmatobacter sp.]
MPAAIRATILIVDDSADWRAQAREILQDHGQWHIVGEACDGLQAIRKAEELDPDLVLLDIGMPVMNGLEAAAQIRQTSPRSKIVFVTQENDPEIISAALAAGASGYVRKTHAGHRLLDAMASALRNC